jgi:hypothetical protein
MKITYPEIITEPQNLLRISKVLTILSCLLWCFSIFKSELVLNCFGLISSFPAVFFIALGLLTIAAVLLWLSKEKHTWLCLLQIILLILSLYLTPLLLEGTARFPAAYQNYGFVDYIITNGRLNPQVVWYHSWPGTWIFFAAVFKILNINDPLFVMGIFNTVAQIFFLIPLFLIFKNFNKNEDNRFWAFAWIFILINWTNQEYFSAQAICYLLALLIFAMALSIVKYSKENTAQITVLVILMSAVMISHLVTALIALLTIIFLFSIWKKRNFSLIVFLSILLGAWTIYGSIVQVQAYLPQFIREAFNVDSFFLSTIFSRFGETSAEHAFINNSRVIFTLVFIITALVGFVLLYLRNRLISKDTLSVLSFSISAVCLLPVFVYSGEFIIRVFLFMLVPVAYFTCQLLENRYLIPSLIIILILGIPAHMLTHYGNELVENTPKTELVYSNFIFEHSGEGIVVGLPPPVTFKDLDKYIYYSLWSAASDIKYSNRYDSITRLIPDNGKAIYVGLCSRLDNVGWFTMGNTYPVTVLNDWIGNSNDYQLTYNNTDILLYSWTSN